MIVVDSSVWISYFRGVDCATTRNLKLIEDEGLIVVGDLVLLEVLQGTRDDAHAAKVEMALRRFQLRRMLDDQIAVATARNYRSLRQSGITVRKTADLIIATFCLLEGYALLHDDRDFTLMAPHLGLRMI